MVSIDTAIILENLSSVYKHYTACISCHMIINSDVVLVWNESGCDTSCVGNAFDASIGKF